MLVLVLVLIVSLSRARVLMAASGTDLLSTTTSTSSALASLVVCLLLIWPHAVVLLTSTASSFLLFRLLRAGHVKRRLRHILSCSLISCTLVLSRATLILLALTSGLLLSSGTLSEEINQVVVVILLVEGLELASLIHQMGGLHQRTTVKLALPIDVTALQKLLVKHHDNLLLRLANHSASCAERHVSALD